MSKPITASMIALFLSLARALGADVPQATAGGLPSTIPSAVELDVAADSDLATQVKSLAERRTDQTAAALDQQLAELSSMQSAASAELGPDNAKVMELHRQISELKIRLEGLQQTLLKKSAAPANVTFLGLATEAVSEDLRQQLQLQPGFGLIVEAITPNGPAQSAGIVRYDVLTKLDDQLLITPSQLEILIRAHKTGDEVTLTLIHAGKTITATAKLVTSRPGGPLTISSPTKLRLYFDNAHDAKFSPPVSSPFSSSISITDGKYALTLDDKNSLKATELRTGNILFDGPIGTDQERDSVPAVIQSLFKQLRKQHETPPLAAMTITGTGVFSTTQPAQIVRGDDIFYLQHTDGTTEAPVPLAQKSRSVVWSSKSHTLVLTFTADKPAHLLALRADGTMLFDGPVRSTQDQASIPAELRDGFDFLTQHPDAGHTIGN